jgi:hypothetical protein
LIVEGLTRFEHVHSVSIDHAQFSEPWELQIPSLTKLTLRWCRGLDGNWLEGLQRCTALTAIALRGGDLNRQRFVSAPTHAIAPESAPARLVASHRCRRQSAGAPC